MRRSLDKKIFGTLFRVCDAFQAGHVVDRSTLRNGYDGQRDVLGRADGFAERRYKHLGIFGHIRGHLMMVVVHGAFNSIVEIDRWRRPSLSHRPQDSFPIGLP